MRGLLFGDRRVAALGVALLIVPVLVGVSGAHNRVLYGEASYYANSLSGNTMACGGTYRPWKMVAAHRTHPCGTRLKVRNRANGRVVYVTVRDRGPYADGRILDLSRRAARRLRFLRRGVTRVRAVIRN